MPYMIGQEVLLALGLAAFLTLRCMFFGTKMVILRHPQGLILISYTII